MLLTVQHYPHLRLEIIVSDLPESKGLPRGARQQSKAYADRVLSWEAYRVDISAERGSFGFHTKIGRFPSKINETMNAFNCSKLCKTKNSMVNKSRNNVTLAQSESERMLKKRQTHFVLCVSCVSLYRL